MTTIKFTEDQILIKLKVNYDADKVNVPNYDFFQAMLDVSDLKDPKTLAAEFNSIKFCNPVAVCSINNSVEFITNMAFHPTGTSKPVFISSVKSPSSAGIHKLSKSLSNVILMSKIPSYKSFLKADSRILQDEVYNNVDKFEEETIPQIVLTDSNILQSLVKAAPGTSSKDLFKSILEELNEHFLDDEDLASSAPLKISSSSLHIMQHPNLKKTQDPTTCS